MRQKAHTFRHIYRTTVILSPYEVRVSFVGVERPPIYVILAMFYLSSLMVAVVYLLFFAK
jgi:hypothetical protein